MHTIIQIKVEQYNALSEITASIKHSKVAIASLGNL